MRREEPLSADDERPRDRVLVTGATGCVGHRLVRALLARESSELLLVVREPSRLAPDARAHRRVRMILSDLRAMDWRGESLGGVETVVLAHTSWGEHAFETNVDATLAVVDALETDRRPHVVYFSTASILASDGSLLTEAGTFGTPYIRSKLTATRALLARDDLAVTIIYPTLVAGGGGDGPPSHLDRLLREVARRDWLLRFVSADASFHVAHAADIARVTARAVADPPAPGHPRQLVLGGPPVSADAMADALLSVRGRRRLAKVPITGALAELLIRVFRVRLAPWDRYCLATRHFTYDRVTAPASFGDPPAFDSLEALIAASLGD